MARQAETKTGGRPATTGVIPGLYALSVGKPSTIAPLGWRWMQLTEVARLETGHTPSRKHPEYWGGNIPWIGLKDATENHGRIIDDTYQHTNELGIANSSARILPKHTVCLSRTASVGYVVVMGRSMATSQDFVNWICTEAIDYRFLKYVLLAERESFLRFASGTTHQTIYFPEVKAFHICLPPIDEQNAIASVLSSLDNKIELNHRMNETLEKMARAIFKDWFVDFGPTRAKAEGHPPYISPELWSLFPDSLDDDVKPMGWNFRPLDQIADFLNGLALQKFPADDNGFLPVIKIAELRTGNTAKSDKASLGIPAPYIVDDGDILFSWSGSLTHLVWTGGRGALNQHLFKVTSDKFPKWFVFFWISEHMPSFQATAASKATTMGHIQRFHLTEAQTIVASDKVMQAADELIRPLFDKMLANNLQSKNLSQLRDLLLPKLVSGEIRLNEAEKIVEDAV